MDETRVEVQLRSRTTELAHMLLICAAAALAVALISGRWPLVAFAAPLLGVLCSATWQQPVRAMSVRASPKTLRCFEGDGERVEVELEGTPGDGTAALSVTAPDGMLIDSPDPESGPAAPQRRTVSVSAQRWGRYPLRARVEVVAPGGLLAASGAADIGEAFVFPLVPPPSTAMPRAEMLDRIGTHLTRHAGPGVEYADIRPYVPGDQLRTVNWSVSARRATLHVTQRLTDRSVDVVVLVDMSLQPPGPATAATQRSVEGALQVVQSALRSGDRVGIVGLGGQQPRWLGPDIGQRQFYRVLDAVLGAGGDYHDTPGTLAPRAAIPPGAVVIAFSTLLEADFGLALMDLSGRGHVVVVIDVLEGSPLGDGEEPTLNRMWALQRAAMYRDMRVMGVEVVSWPTELTLDVAMRLLPKARAGTRRRRR